MLYVGILFGKRSLYGHIKSPRNLRDFGGNFVRKAVRESMFRKSPFYGRKLSNDLDNLLKMCYNHISNFS